MIENIELESWDEFDDAINSLNEERRKLEEKGFGLVSPAIFRGQQDHSWPLSTTLERSMSRQMNVSEYYRLISVCLPAIEAFTGVQWSLPEYGKLMDWGRNYESKFKPPPAYDYLVYLRHHGFPSPLLDWSRSPYVAAHFAFANTKSEKVAIFAYVEYAGEAKTGSSEEPSINGLGPYVRTHNRHFLQRSEYTICWSFEDGEWVFTPHQHVAEMNTKTQDLFWKITLPKEIQLDALRSLDIHNLNDFSLFQNEEALLRTLWNREHLLRQEHD